MRNKIRGFTLVELAIVVALAGVASVYAIRWIQTIARDAHAQVVKARVEYVLDAIDRYYMNQVTVVGTSPMSTSAFPANITSLQTSGFIPTCSAAAVSAGQCIDYRYLPIGTAANGQLITLSRATVSGQPVSRFTVSLSTVTDRPQKSAIIAAIGTLPGFTIDAAGNNVVIDLHRPGQLAQMDMLVSRDGSREMLADWNFGNHSLNVGKNVSAQNVSASNNVTATNNVNARNVIASTDVTAGRNVSASSNVTANLDVIAGRDVNVTRNVTTNGWLRVKGDTFLDRNATVASNLTVNGTSTLKNNVTAQNKLTVNGDLQADKNATVGTKLTVAGKVATDVTGITLNNSDIFNPRYIIDVNDMTIAGMRDRTLVTGLRSTGSARILGSTGTLVNKPQCPSGYTPAIEIWNIAVGYDTVLLDPSNTQAWYSSASSTQWRLYFRVNVQANATSSARAWHYKGVLGYTTWCEF